jgi:hypothetical protein
MLSGVCYFWNSVRCGGVWFGKFKKISGVVWFGSFGLALGMVWCGLVRLKKRQVWCGVDWQKISKKAWCGVASQTMLRCLYSVLKFLLKISNKKKFFKHA